MILAIPLSDEDRAHPVEQILDVIADLEAIRVSMTRQGMDDSSESLLTVIRDLQWQIEQLR